MTRFVNEVSIAKISNRRLKKIVVEASFVSTIEF